MTTVDYVITTRNIKNGKFGAEPDKVRFLTVPRAAAVPAAAHAAQGQGAIDAWVQSVRDAADGNPNEHSISLLGDVLVFIHGYNNDLATIMKRQRQLHDDLTAEGWKGVVIGFDWPSDDSTLNYYEDRRDAATTAVELVQSCITLLSLGQAEGCITNVHLIGHSTGAYVIMKAFAEADLNYKLKASNWRVGQVAFIGGDVAREALGRDEEGARLLFDRCMRLTNYSNGFDFVLGVSNAKRLGTKPRAGRSGLPDDAHPKAVNVNCSEYFSGLDPKKSTHFGTFPHSWHIGDRVFARDLAMTLEGAVDRFEIPTRKWVDNELVLQNKPRPRFMAAWAETVDYAPEAKAKMAKLKGKKG